MSSLDTLYAWRKTSRNHLPVANLPSLLHKLALNVCREDFTSSSSLLAFMFHLCFIFEFWTNGWTVLFLNFAETVATKMSAALGQWEKPRGVHLASCIQDALVQDGQGPGVTKTWHLHWLIRTLTTSVSFHVQLIFQQILFLNIFQFQTIKFRFCQEQRKNIWQTRNLFLKQLTSLR